MVYKKISNIDTRKIGLGFFYKANFYVFRNLKNSNKKHRLEKKVKKARFGYVLKHVTSNVDLS